MRLFSLALRQARAGRAVLATLTLLVLVMSFLAAAAPRALTNVYDSALTDLLDRTSPLVKDVRIIGQVRGFSTEEPVEASDMDDVKEMLLARLPPDLAGEVGRSTYVADGLNLPILDRLEDGADVPNTTFALQFRSGFADAVRYVRGRSPGRTGTYVVHGDHGTTNTLPRFEVAISARTAAAMTLAVGDRFVIGEGNRAEVVVKIAGVFEPTDAASSYWGLDGRPLEPVEDRRVRPPRLMGIGIIGPEAFSDWFAEFSVGAEFVWRYEVDRDRLVAADSATVAAAVEAFGSGIGFVELPGVDGLYDQQFELAGNLGAVLRDFVAQRRSAQAVMGVALAGLLAVGLAVIALAAQLVAERRRDSLGLIRARGASLGELTVLVLVEIGLVTAPAAALGYAAAVVAVPGVTSVTSVALCVLVATTTLALSAVLALVQHRRAARSERRDIVSVRPSARRLLLDAGVVVLALLGVLLLRRRGLTTEAVERGADPFLVAVPVLLGLAAGLVALRIYPYPLRLLGRATARWRGAVPFLGVARTSRDALTSTLPLVAVLLGLALAVFGSVVDSGLAKAQADRAWREVAADVRVRQDGIDAAQLEQIARLPEVTAVAPAVVEEGASLRSHLGLPVTAIGIDLDAYRAIVAGSSLRVPTVELGAATGAALPALVTPEVLRTVTDETAEIQWGDLRFSHEIAIQGMLDTPFPAAPNDTAVVLVPYQSLTELPGSPAANTLFLGGAGIDTGRVAEILGADISSVVARERLYREIRDAPLADGVRTVFATGVAALGTYCALAVLLAIAIGAGARARTLAYLRTLGLSHRQARVLVLLELGPLVVTATLGGALLGHLLPYVVGPAVDLRPYSGGDEVASYPLDPAALGFLVGGLAALVTVAVVVDAAVSRRRHLGAALRVGE